MSCLYVAGCRQEARKVQSCHTCRGPTDSINYLTCRKRLGGHLLRPPSSDVRDDGREGRESGSEGLQDGVSATALVGDA